MNNLPQSCQHLKTFFADYTNITAIGQSKAVIQQDLIRLSFLLQVNKLCLDTDKTYQINIKSAQSSTDLRNSFELSGSVTKNAASCKFVVVFLDNKL